MELKLHPGKYFFEKSMSSGSYKISFKNVRMFLKKYILLKFPFAGKLCPWKKIISIISLLSREYYWPKGSWKNYLLKVAIVSQLRPWKQMVGPQKDIQKLEKIFFKKSTVLDPRKDILQKIYGAWPSKRYSLKIHDFKSVMPLRNVLQKFSWFLKNSFFKNLQL